MKQSFANPFFRACAKLLAASALFLAACASARAQAPQAVDGRLRLESLDRLAPKADNSVDINVDGILLNIGKAVLSDSDPDEKAVKEIIEGLKGVYVKSYEFKSAGAFADADLTALREQLRAPGWSRLINVKSHDDDFDDAEVYVATEGGQVKGLAVLVAEPKELTVINIVGAIDLEKLRKLEGTLGIPHIGIQHKRRATRRDDDK
jgi:Domain of unknown function (DUF4252)